VEAGVCDGELVIRGGTEVVVEADPSVPESLPTSWTPEPTMLPTVIPTFFSASDNVDETVPSSRLTTLLTVAGKEPGTPSVVFRICFVAEGGVRVVVPTIDLVRPLPTPELPVTTG
jgi:hypothetical protein